MDMLSFERVEADVRHLSLTEQLKLMQRLAQFIQEQTIRQQQIVESQLVAMAADPDIQRELRLIEAEFAVTESDGLDQVA